MQRHIVKNDLVKIEVIEWRANGSSHAPILFVPGMFGTAETYRNEIESNWSHRHCISLTLRGRGNSDAPDSGYTFSHHVSDIAETVKQLDIKKVSIVAHSRGAAYALGFAAAYPKLIGALALLDHPPLHLPIDPGWAEKWSAENAPWIPKPNVIRALQREAGFVDLRDSLKILECPILFVAGGTSDAMLTGEDLNEFSRGLKNCIVHVEHESGHDLHTLQLRRLFEPLLPI